MLLNPLDPRETVLYLLDMATHTTENTMIATVTVETGTFQVRMPDHYDPALVTIEDLRCDQQLEIVATTTGKALAYVEDSDGWHVTDVDGGTWWPHEDAAAEIALASNPGATAVGICRDEPMRGSWHS